MKNLSPHHNCRQLLIPVLVLLICLTLPASAAAQSRSDTGAAGLSQRLRIGLIPEQHVFAQKSRYQPLFDYLGAALGVSFDIQILSRYGNLIGNFNELELDAAFFGSFTGAMAIKQLGMVPLARPHYTSGLSSYYGVIFVRKQSGIRQAADMRGKKMVFVDRATTAGYLLPLDYFQQNGIKDYTHWFSDYYFAGTHEDAILEVLKGHADVGAAKSTIFYRMALANPQILEDLQILASSPHVPANTFGVRGDLPQELVVQLREQLLGMHLTPAGRTVLEGMGVQRFLQTSCEDFVPVFDYARHIGLDLSTYQYVND